MPKSKNIIVAAYENEVKKFLNLGSTCMYPKDTKGYLSEDQILKGKLEPTNEGYALAKIVSYKLCNYINEINSQYTYKTMIPFMNLIRCSCQDQVSTKFPFKSRSHFIN